MPLPPETYRNIRYFGATNVKNYTFLDSIDWTNANTKKILKDIGPFLHVLHPAPGATESYRVAHERAWSVPLTHDQIIDLLWRIRRFEVTLKMDSVQGTKKFLTADGISGSFSAPTTTNTHTFTWWTDTDPPEIKTETITVTIEWGGEISDITVSEACRNTNFAEEQYDQWLGYCAPISITSSGGTLLSAPDKGYGHIHRIAPPQDAPLFGGFYTVKHGPSDQTQSGYVSTTGTLTLSITPEVISTNFSGKTFKIPLNLFDYNVSDDSYTFAKTPIQYYELSSNRKIPKEVEFCAKRHRDIEEDESQWAESDIPFWIDDPCSPEARLKTKGNIDSSVDYSRLTLLLENDGEYIKYPYPKNWWKPRLGLHKTSLTYINTRLLITLIPFMESDSFGFLLSSIPTVDPHPNEEDYEESVANTDCKLYFGPGHGYVTFTMYKGIFKSLFSYDSPTPGVASCEIRPVEYWTHPDKDGVPTFDKRTGRRLQ